MAQNNYDQSPHGFWSSNTMFVLAAVGSAVGLGNIWKFPYITGENGGAAFFFVYLICICAIGIPVMMAEIMLGRAGRMSPVNSLLKIAREQGLSRKWGLLGWAGVGGGLVILSFYSVIAGWILAYVFQTFSGGFNGIDLASSQGVFADLISNPWISGMWFTVFLVATGYFVARGVNRGLELVIRFCMPLLFVLLIVILIYGISRGGFGDAFKFMFHLDFNNLGLSWDSLVKALGHAFFTLSIGMGAIMAYGAYMPQQSSIKSAVGIIVVVDTLVAVIAGLAIFSIAYAHGSDPGQTIGLLFYTVPTAFGNLWGGVIFGGLFFVLVTFAAFTSAISLLEPAIAYFVEKFNTSRAIVAIFCVSIAWILGLFSVFSFNILSDWTIDIGDKAWTIFDSLDHLTQWVILPLGGLFICILTAWFIPWKLVGSVLDVKSERGRLLWKIFCGVLAPLAILAVFVLTFFGIN
ncbi:MAG: sodium-dependent transporter [Gammaproteobacteria bacterium]|nr:sodium-dependent transporter [Gammaproteobacteria bacterium]MDE0251460.1 sodium-dependent transporter [Gammaproteobacteria bacterium]MDE0401857.1 sodium-dependent transporter [Gammaproteobacteria bacterium]